MAYFPALFGGGGGDGKPNAPDEISIANYVGYFFYFIPLLLARPSIVSAGKSFPLTPRNTPKSPSSSSSSSPWSWSSSIAHLACTRHGRHARGMRVPAADHPKSVSHKGPAKSDRRPHTRLKANEITRKSRRRFRLFYVIRKL